jgi:hypothetical protein
MTMSDSPFIEAFSSDPVVRNIHQHAHRKLPKTFNPKPPANRP